MSIITLTLSLTNNNWFKKNNTLFVKTDFFFSLSLNFCLFYKIIWTGKSFDFGHCQMPWTDFDFGRCQLPWAGFDFGHCQLPWSGLFYIQLLHDFILLTHCLASQFRYSSKQCTYFKSERKATYTFSHLWQQISLVSSYRCLIFEV